MANLKYPLGKKAILGASANGGPIDWDADPLYIMLVNTTYAALSDATKKTHDFYDDVSANEVTGTGYTAGGQLLAGASIASDGADGYYITFTDPAWTTATITAYGAVIFKKVGGTFGADDPLLLFLDFGGAVTSTAATFTVDIPGTGLYVLP